MSDESNRLRRLLACHGSDIAEWPSDAKREGLRALRHPETALLIEQERCFEERLRARTVPEPAHGFTQNIIAAALLRNPAPRVASWLHEVFKEVRPMAFAAMLALGFVIGFSMTNPPQLHRQSAAVPSLSDDEGAIL